MGESFSYDANKGKLTINTKEAKIIQIPFQTFKETESITKTARQLNQLGFTTKSWISKTNRLQIGKKFNKQNVRRILQNQI